MDSTVNPEQTDPRGVFSRAEIARAFEQIGAADEPLMSTPAQDAARPPAATPPAAAKNVQVPGDRPSLVRPAVRGFVGLLLAACIGVAAIAWQSAYGDAARQIIASWAPQLVLTSSTPLEKPPLPVQPSPSAVQAAAAKTALSPTAPLAQTAAEDVVPTAAPSPELTQLLQSMARDLATLGQAIEQLKASQEQMARDNANAAEQLKASQERMARVIAKTSEAKASEQNLRPRMSAPPPRPTATPTRKPVPTL